MAGWVGTRNIAEVRGEVNGRRVPSYITVNNGPFRALLVLWLLGYLFWAMRRVYAQTVPMTALKYIGLSLGYLVVLNVVLAGVAAFTLLTL